MRSKSKLLLAGCAGGLALVLGVLRAHAAQNEPANAVARLANLLRGTFRGSSPGNDLTMVFSRLPASGPSSQLEKLEIRVTGSYKGDAVLLRGLFRISNQGEVLWLVFLPGVDPIEATRRFHDPTFAPTELEAGCWALLSNRNGAFEGPIKPAPNCRNALRAGEVQSVGPEWKLRFSSGEIRFENRETGEVLTFARTPGK